MSPGWLKVWVDGVLDVLTLSHTLFSLSLLLLLLLLSLSLSLSLPLSLSLSPPLSPSPSSISFAPMFCFDQVLYTWLPQHHPSMPYNIILWRRFTTKNHPLFPAHILVSNSGLVLELLSTSHIILLYLTICVQLFSSHLCIHNVTCMYDNIVHVCTYVCACVHVCVLPVVV